MITASSGDFVIQCSAGEAINVGGTWKETTGQDVSTSTYALAVNTDPVGKPAASVFTATTGVTSLQGVSLAERKVYKLIDSTAVTALALVPGVVYSMWGRCIDRGETYIVLLARFQIS